MCQTFRSCASRKQNLLNVLFTRLRAPRQVVELVVEHEDCFRQIDLVDTSEMFFAEPMVRIYTSAVMSRAQWDSREVGSLLPKSSRTQSVGVGRFDQTRTATRTDTRPASESKPDNPGFCPDPAGAGIASCGPALSVSEAGPAATAHSGVMAHVS